MKSQIPYALMTREMTREIREKLFQLLGKRVCILEDTIKIKKSLLKLYSFIMINDALKR